MEFSGFVVAVFLLSAPLLSLVRAAGAQTVAYVYSFSGSIQVRYTEVWPREEMVISGTTFGRLPSYGSIFRVHPQESFSSCTRLT